MDDVLIVGAGPTGLVLALWLRKQGVSVRIIDRSPGISETSRALAVQPRTLELYRQLGMAEPVVAAGHQNAALNLWARGKKQARLKMNEAGEDVTPFAFMLVYPQDRHEHFLEAKLKDAEILIERQTELLSFEDKGDHVAARVRGPAGDDVVLEAKYFVGCDGARSSVRHGLGNEFEGGTYRQVFYVADVELAGLEPIGDIHVAVDSADFVAVLSYGKTRQRLIGVVSDSRADRAETLTFDDVAHEAIDKMGIDVRKVHWFSTYRVHHRVTNRFRVGRIFLAGDAAHVHSPAGGQGMNTGILDAINLAWKLAAVLKGKARDGLLETYDTERRAFARLLVDTTDRVFTFVTAGGPVAAFVRTRLAPIVAGAAYQSRRVREFMFRTVSQTRVSYAETSTLSEGKAGSIRGGDRLPWVRCPAREKQGHDNFAPFVEMGWQAHVYGRASAALCDWCERRELPLFVFEWTEAHRKAGLARDGLYLVRPDTWVALADEEQSIAKLEAYFTSRGLFP